jgi:hypothetical protein
MMSVESEEIKQTANDLNEILAANFMAVRVSTKYWSGKITDAEVSEEVINSKGASRKSGKFVKDLFVGADSEIKKINTLQNSVRSLVYARTTTLSSNAEGTQRGDRMINAMKALELLREIKAPILDGKDAVQEFKSVYDLRVQEGLANLQGLGNPSDYPPVSEIESRYGVTVDLFPMPRIADFSRVNIPAALAKGLGEIYAAQEKAKVDNALGDIKGRLLNELQRMATMLGKHGSGEKTRLYDSLVTNLQDLVSLTRSMNIYQNPELDKLADKIEGMLLQHPVEVYRNHPLQAAQVAKAAQGLAVEAALDAVWS